MQEVTWKPIPGFPYEASDDGRIRPTNPRYKNGRGAELKPWIVEQHGRKAAYVSLHHEGKRTKFLVHRLVCMAFHGLPPEGKDDCCHQDDDSLNNRASNLKWDTHSKNIKATWDEERIVEARARWEDACGIQPVVEAPRGDIPF